MSQDNSENLLVNGTVFQITQNFVSPSDAGISINGQSYTLNPGVITHVNGTAATYIELINISYLPILQSDNLKIWADVPQGQNQQVVNLTTVPTTTLPVTVASTTVSSGTSTNSTNSTLGGLAPTSAGLPPIVPIGIGVVVAVIAGYALTRRSRPSARKKR